MHIKKFPKVAVVATKFNFLQYTYRIRINHKTLYSQTFPGLHFGSWTSISENWIEILTFSFKKMCVLNGNHFVKGVMN